MSEVMRWTLKGFLPGVEGMCKAVMRPEVVMASDYDAAQSELAALREELEPKTVKELLEHEHVKALSAKQINDVLSGLHEKNKDLQQRLADAERRNADFVELLERMLHDDEMTVHWFAQSIDQLLTKPTESGANE